MKFTIITITIIITAIFYYHCFGIISISRINTLFIIVITIVTIVVTISI